MPIVNDFDTVEAEVLESDLDAGRASVESIFYQLFDRGCKVLRVCGEEGSVGGDVAPSLHTCVLTHKNNLAARNPMNVRARDGFNA